MNISTFCSNGNAFFDCEYIKSIAFKNTATWVKCTLLSVICSIFGNLQDSFARLNRFECLLPLMNPA